MGRGYSIPGGLAGLPETAVLHCVLQYMFIMSFHFTGVEHI